MWDRLGHAEAVVIEVLLEIVLKTPSPNLIPFRILIFNRRLGLEARTGLRNFNFFLNIEVDYVVVAFKMIGFERAHLIVARVPIGATWVEIRSASVDGVDSLSLGCSQF